MLQVVHKQGRALSAVNVASTGQMLETAHLSRNAPTNNPLGSLGSGVIAGGEGSVDVDAGKEQHDGPV